MSYLAILVLNYNGLSLLQEYLPILVTHSQEYAVILIDNGSTDGSLDYVRLHFPDVLCIVHDRNYGVTKGYNLALEQVQATYYVFINNDVLVTKGWLSDMLALMESNPSIAACQPKICSRWAPNYFDYAGAAGGFIDHYGYPFCRGRIFDYLEKDEGQYNDTMAVFWASGACLLFRAEAFHALGGFDELFFAHFDEIDLCWRAHLSNWQVYYCGTSTVYHVGGGSLAYTNPKKTYLNFKNRALMYYKYYSDHTYKLAIQLALDIIAAMRMLLLGKFAHGLAIFRARIDFCKLKKQCTLYKSAVSLPHMYKGNIVIDFFLKRKKTFSKLMWHSGKKV